jgi:hypothetical protein
MAGVRRVWRADWSGWSRRRSRREARHGTDSRVFFYNVSTGAVAALLTVALKALNGLPLQRERVEAVPEIGRQSCRVVAQLFHVLDRCAQLPLELLYLLLSTPVHVQEARR